MIILPANTLSGGYEVANSCRWTSGDSPYMHKTPGSAGNLDLWTLSIWFKRGTLTNSDANEFIYVQSDSNNFDRIRISDDNLLQWKGLRGGSTSFELKPTMVFGDPTAWYHIVFQWDSADSTADDRMKIFVNGTQVTSFGTRSNPSSGLDSLIGDAEQTYVGGHNTGTNWEGYFAEYVYINASQLPPTSFGEFDEDSPTIWKPKDVSGLTFGTNGFYLDFEDSSNLGNDANGGTDFTENNLAATDQATDTPTNNFATMNPLVKGNTASTFSEGNLKVAAGGGWGHAVGNIGVAYGKWYWEVDEINANNNAFFGICSETAMNHLTNDSTPYSEDGLMLWFYDGRRTIDGTDSEGEFSGWGTTHGFALDLDSSPRTIKFYKDGSLEATENLTSNFPAGEFVFPIFMGSASSNPAIVEFNFGNPVTALASGNNDANGYGSFEFSPPSGYIAICTKNLGSDGG